MKKGLDIFPVWGTGTSIYIVTEDDRLYGQYGDIDSDYAKLYGLDLIKELTQIKVDKNQFWFDSEHDVLEYLEGIKEVT